MRRNDAYRREGDEIDEGDEGDCYPGNRRSQIETDPENRNVHRNGFDSPDAEGIAEPDWKMGIMLSVVENHICRVCLVIC